VSRSYTARVFKSGNSMALRLPKELGLKDGDIMVLREEAGRYEFEPSGRHGKIDLTGVWGAIPDLKPLSPEDREIDERELDWEGKRLPRG
jgi:antitoxin VapB